MKGKGLKNPIGHTSMCLMISGLILHQRTKPVKIPDQDNMKRLGRMVQRIAQNLAQLSGLGNTETGGAAHWARKNCGRTGLAEM